VPGLRAATRRPRRRRHRRGAPATTGARTCQEARDTPGAGIGQGRPGYAGGEARTPTEVGGGHEKGGIARAGARRSVAVHDGWAPYRKYDCTHALCKAHPLRELIPPCALAPSLIDLLCEANTEAARSAQRHIRQERQRHYRERYDRIVDQAQAALPSCSPSKASLLSLSSLAEGAE